MRMVPLVLALLVHVLRRFSQPTAGAAATEAAVQKVLKKTDFYQRAIKLMLHHADAAKFVLRDGEGDRALVRRLNLLKSARARKFFQSLAWKAHCSGDRAMTWDNIATISDDQEVFQAFKEAFEQGRTPMFEIVETAGSQSMVQLCHISFKNFSRSSTVLRF